MRYFNPPQRVTLGSEVEKEKWVQGWINRLVPEILSAEEDALESRYTHRGYTISIYRPYEDETLIWTASRGDYVYGIGVGRVDSSGIHIAMAAIARGHQRKGIYRSVLAHLLDDYGLPIHSDGQQTEASGRLWKSLGASDEGNFYTLHPSS